jgi:hypothetical protein
MDWKDMHSCLSPRCFSQTRLYVTGDWFDFHGQCDLVLAHSPSFGLGLGLDAHLRTSGRYDYSYISSAAIRIGSDVLEVGSFGEYFFNSIGNAEMPAVMADRYNVTYTKINEKESHFEIQVEKDQHIRIKTFKDMVSVDFDKATPFHFADSSGLMGDFRKGSKLSRDGSVMTDNNAFGQEWQGKTSNDRLIFRYSMSSVD